MFQMLTLICPTYNRQSCLVRSSRFWSNRDVCVIYADGSCSACSGASLDSPNIRYLHYPVGFHQRLLAMLAEVKTPYVCMMGDDEFFIPSALLACVDYLESHPDYVSCMGRAVSFARSRNRIVLKPKYPLLESRHLHGDNSCDRLRGHFSHYVPAHCYSVTRTEVFRSSVESALSIELDIFAIFELVEEFLVVSAGKSIVLPMLYWLRSYEAPPLRNTGDQSLDPGKQFAHLWKSADSGQQKRYFCRHLSSATGGAVSEIEVETIFDCYLEFCSAIAESPQSSFLQRLKSSCPDVLLRSLKSLSSDCKMLKGLFDSQANQYQAALNELRDQGVYIDEAGLAECIDSIKNSWSLV